MDITPSQNIYNFYKNYRKNIFEFVGISSFILSFIGVLVSFFTSCDTRYFITVFAFSFESIGLSIICIILMKNLTVAEEVTRNSQKEIEKLKNVINQYHVTESTVSTIFHGILHEHRDLTNQMNIDTRNGVILSAEQKMKREFSKKEFYNNFLTNVKQIFDLITRDTCSLCIKILQKNTQNPTEYKYDVKTYLRDPSSRRSRSEIDNEPEFYPYYKNTAFDSILGHDKKNFFLSNNLQELEKEGKYKNFNPNWKNFYNACLVIPIRAVNTEKHSNYNRNIGFLCIDNMKGGFDEKIGFNLLAAFADLLYCRIQTDFFSHSHQAIEEK